MRERERERLTDRQAELLTLGVNKYILSHKRSLNSLIMGYVLLCYVFVFVLSSFAIIWTKRSELVALF